MTLSIITPSLLDLPPTNWPVSPSMSQHNSSFGIGVIPTHNFSTAPALDVLLLHGGAATRAPNLNSTFQFVRDRYPSLQYLITVCTGAGIAARAGVLDGKRATTNKRAWVQTTALGPKVKWVSHARWVVDGNIWTASGVGAGIDAVLAWIGNLYGDVAALGIANMMEYERHTNSSWDPFAELYNLTDTTS
jgi:transcriptional regulator GlxA family with amidase domain